MVVMENSKLKTWDNAIAVARSSIKGRIENFNVTQDISCKTVRGMCSESLFTILDLVHIN
jgi:hypothetical protein